jgi:siroheme synthase-like protein
MKHSYMPISVSMRDRPCLVVGGGVVAVRKVENMLEYDVPIVVVAPEVDPKLEYHAEKGRIKLEKREYRPPEAGEYGIVISATDNSDLNKQVYADAHERGVLVNVVDDPSHCDFIVPAVLRRDCLTVSITTDGKAPFMSGHLRAILDTIFPKHWDRLMKLAANFRVRVREQWADSAEKKNMCYAEFLEADWKKMFEDMNDEQVEAELARILDSPA